MDAFVLTEQGIITGSFLQCPLFLGLLGIGLCRAISARTRNPANVRTTKIAGHHSPTTAVCRVRVRHLDQQQYVAPFKLERVHDGHQE